MPFGNYKVCFFNTKGRFVCGRSDLLAIDIPDGQVILPEGYRMRWHRHSRVR
jgi:hypothetical protein